MEVWCVCEGMAEFFASCKPFPSPPCIGALRQENRGMPPDQIIKFRERKQLLDRILSKDAEEMKRICTVEFGRDGLWEGGG